MNLQAEAEFFKDIAGNVSELLNSYKGQAKVANYKAAGDFATEVDIAVEKLIVSEIKKKFPSDLILAEEEHSGTAISDNRTWIIDPICGTTNLGRGIRNFCTNIALADKQVLIASCVVDHSQNDYFWSIGNQQIFINDKLYEPQTVHENFGVVIDIDFGALGKVGECQVKKHAKAAERLALEPGYMLQSMSSSLCFAYTAIGKVDGFINVDNFPWDICAASFLVQQSGGIITDLAGQPWTLSSVGAIAARSQTVHQKLSDVYTAE